MKSKKTTKIIALILLLVGLAGFTWLSVEKTSTQTNAQAQAACESTLHKRYGDRAIPLLSKCQDTAFAISMTVVSAQDAAQKISAANRGEIDKHTLSMFFLGLMLAGVLILAAPFLKRNRAIKKE